MEITITLPDFSKRYLPRSGKKSHRSYVAQWEAAQAQTTYRVTPAAHLGWPSHEREFKRVPYASGQFYEISRHEIHEENYDDSYCWWCLVREGKYHLPPCHNELCPACHHQIVHCACVVRGLDKTDF